MMNENEDEGQVLGGDVMNDTPPALTVERDGVVVGQVEFNPDGTPIIAVDQSAAGMHDIQPLGPGFAFTPAKPNIETPMVFDEEPPADRTLAPRDI